jgi:hypothetical protein
VQYRAPSAKHRLKRVVSLPLAVVFLTAALARPSMSAT